jgi:adenine deaminase
MAAVHDEDMVYPVLHSHYTLQQKYGIGCPSCGNYMELTEQQFQRLKQELETLSADSRIGSLEDSMKYAGKTQTQINYLKQLEELEKEGK